MKHIISDIIMYLKLNFTTIKIEDTAKYFGYSKFHFSHEFKRIMGFSISEYISALKIELSISELLKNDRTVLGSQIKSGYLSSGTFSNTFSAATGISPAKYKKNFISHYEHLKDFQLTTREAVYKSVCQSTYQSNRYENTSYNRCKVKINNNAGIAFVGIYPSPIANRKPVMGKATLKDSCVFDNIPDGSYYFLVCSMLNSDNPLNYYLLDNCFRGRTENRITFTKDTCKEITITLRETHAEDTPIIINLPFILAETARIPI